MNTALTAANQKKANLERQLSKIADCPIEITIRGLREFTLSAESDKREAFKNAQAFLAPGLKSWKVEYDPETDETYAYFTL